MDELRWPDIFPSPLLNKYNITPDEAIARTEMDGGAARQRRRFDNLPSTINVSFIMDGFVFDMFESWYNNVALEGSVWFLCSLKMGSGFEERECRFVKPYKAAARSHELWEITTQFEIRNVGYLPREWLDLFLEASRSGNDFIDISNRLHVLVDTTMPIDYNGFRRIE